MPGLGTLIVGDDPGSHAYVAGKHRDCAAVGIASIQRELPADATQADVEAVVDELNADPTCTGFIVQLPLPRGLDEQAVLARIDPDKDADGLHPTNLGRLVLDVAATGQRPPAVYAAGHRRAAAPLRRAAVRRARRHRRPRHDERPAARAAADPPDRERDGHLVPHRHPRPGRRRPHRRHRGRRAPAAPGSSRPTWCAPAPSYSTSGRRGSSATTARPASSATSRRRSARWRRYLAPMPGGVGPMTRAMLLANVVDAAESRLRALGRLRRLDRLGRRRRPLSPHPLMAPPRGLGRGGWSSAASRSRSPWSRPVTSSAAAC